MHDERLWDRRQKRDREMHGIPEWEELRSLASAIKEHTLTHLDEYLDQFEANARSNGIHVHWARDAAEHNQIVHGILRDHGATSLIKSKSMLTEECGFRQYMASIGIEKIIPRLERLAVLVRLLSRSALGSPMTQYTSHFRGPRAGGEMHVVLVDNGRSERLGLKEFWTSLKCIRCGACMNTCPVYRRSGGLSYGATYSGPIGLTIDPTFNAHKYSNLPFASTLNGRFSHAYPVKINIHEQIYAWRPALVKPH